MYIVYYNYILTNENYEKKKKILKSNDSPIKQYILYLFNSMENNIIGIK